MFFLQVKYSFLSFVVLLLMFPSAHAQSGKITPRPTPPKENDTEKVFTEEIKINVSAFDRSGRFFAGVGKDDLVILEDFVIHQPTSVRQIPANVLIVLDTGGEDRQAKNFNATRETAKSLIRSLQPEDSIALLEYHDKAEIIAEWTTDRAFLLNVLDKKLKFGRRSGFTEALKLAVKFFQDSNLENRHLVLITDGLDSSGNPTEKEAVVKRVLSSDINVHVFSYTKLEQAVVRERRKSVSLGAPKKELPPGADIPVQGQTKTYPTITINTDREMMKKIKQRSEDLARSEKSLIELSENTNGIIFLPVTLEEMIEKTAYLAQNIDSQYVVTYVPKRPLSEVVKDEIRQIQVFSKREGLQVLGQRKLFVIARQP